MTLRLSLFELPDDETTGMRKGAGISGMLVIIATVCLDEQQIKQPQPRLEVLVIHRYSTILTSEDTSKKQVYAY